MLGIRTKLNLALGTLVVLLLLVSLIALSVFNSFSNLVEHMGVTDLDSIVAAREMHDAVNVLADAAQDSQRNQNALDSAHIESSASRFDRALQLQTARISLVGEQQLTSDIQGKWAEVLNLATGLKDAAEKDQAAVMQGRLTSAIRELRVLLTKLAKLNVASMKARHDEMAPEVERARWQLSVTILVGLIVATAFAVILGRRITTSLRAVTAAAKAVESGILEQHLTVSGRDEFGQLIENFNLMSVELCRLQALDAEKLQRSYQTTQTAIDSLPDAVILVNEHGMVELANETASRLFGIHAGMENSNDVAAWFRDAIERPSLSLDSFGSSVSIEDGAKHRYFLPQSVALRNGEGRAIGTTIILTDVTDFRRLDELKDTLLSMASHELKTPLTSMRIILPLLLEQNVGSLNDRQVDLLKVVCDATERMRDIVENILDLGRMASGRMPMEMKTVFPAELIAKAVAAQQAAFARKQVALCTKVSGDLPAVRCDPSQIDHVLTNLLSNALQYSSSAGSVTVSAAGRDGTVTFFVKDTGCGIAAEHLPRIFEHSFACRVSDDTGTGIGLALVKQVVESHGGRVAVESVVGRGSTFSFTLPVASVAERTQEAETGCDTAMLAEADLSLNQEDIPCHPHGS